MLGIFIGVAIGIVIGFDLKTRGFSFTKKPEKEKIKVKPLEKYAIAKLAKIAASGSVIQIDRELEKSDDFTSYLFYFTASQKRVSGLINIPKKEGKHPLIFLFRGYIDRENYTTGDGTRRAAEAFAKNGFITVAPDFLGYGDSDNPSINVLEARFETYTTAITLLASLSQIDNALDQFDVSVDTDKVGVWGHSNGGQIALTVLETTGVTYPTVLWAPVTKPFPYSILYYTDEADDRGRAMRKVVAEFEKDYIADKYSLTQYLHLIQAPIQLHQGTDDDAVPQKWSDGFIETMEKLEKKVDYYVYQGEDHNFTRGAWERVITRDIAFYNKHWQ